MADPIDILIRGDDQASRALTTARGSVTDLDAAVEGSKKGFVDFGNVAEFAIGGIAADLAANLGAALVDVGAQVFSFAGESNQALRDLQSSLGISAEEASTFGAIAEDVFLNNFGGSIGEATAAVGEVQRQLQSLGDVGSEALQLITEGGFALQDTFGVDMATSVDGVKVLMSEFGMSAQESLDLITTGFQKGLPEDFLESIGEYSIQFQEAGFSAEEMFSVLATGAEQGVLGTDKIGDAVKEFRIRFMEQSDEIIEASTDVFNALGESFQLDPNAVIAVSNDAAAVEKALRSLGFSAEAIEGADLAEPLMVWDEALGQNVEVARNFGSVVNELIREGIADGTMTAADAFALLTQGLGKFEDEFAANSAGAKIFGTQWEDLAGQFVDNVDMMAFGLEDIAGATDSLMVRYDNFGAVAQTVWRQTLVALRPLGQALLDLASVAMPFVLAALQGLQAALPPIIDVISGNFVPIVAGLAAAILTAVVPAFITWATTAGAAAIATITALAPVIAPIAAIGAAVALLAKAWQTDFGGIRTTITTWWDGTGKPIFEQLKQWLEQTLTAALQALADFWTGTLQPALQTVWDFISQDLIPLFGRLVSDTFETVQRGIRSLSDFWTGTLKPALQAVWQFMTDPLIPLLRALANVMTAVVGLAVRSLADAYNQNLRPAFDAISGFITGTLKPAFERALAGAIDTAKSATSGLVDFWNNSLKPAFGAIKSAIDTVAGPAFNALKGFAEGVSGAVNGIKSAIESVIGWLTQLADKISSLPGLPKDYKQQSPSPIEQSFLDIGQAVEQITTLLPLVNVEMTRLTTPFPLNELSTLAAGGTTMIDQQQRNTTANISMMIDARGNDSRDMRRVVQDAVGDALRQAGVRADIRLRAA